MPLRLFALSFAMAASVALAACSPREPDIVKLGVLAPRTGTYALRGNDLVNGALLAVEELNASKYKVHGQATKFELLTYDDRGEVEKSLEGAQTFLDQKVVAIIGPLNTPQAEVVVPVIAAAGTPNFITATAADLTGLGGGSAFRLLANDDLQGRAMAILCRDRLKASRIAVVVEKSAYGRGLSEAFSRSLQKDGATSIELAIDVEPTEKVSASMASKIAAAKVDTVVLFARELQLTSLLDAVKDIQYTDVVVLGTNVIRNKNVASASVLVKALYATATALDATEYPGGQAFLAAFAHKYGTQPVWGAHYAYDAVYALAGAAQKSGSFDPAALVSTLEHSEPMTKVVPMQFAETGEQKYPPIALYKVEGQSWVMQLNSMTW